MKTYEGLYIFAGVAKDEILETSLAKALAEVTRLGGNVISQEVQGKRTFARPMKKKDSGTYVAVRFELDPSKVAELVKRYRLVEEVFRVRILAVDERLEAKLAEQKNAAARREAAKALRNAANAPAETPTE
ncbi:MAG: 30S ribosomal protein S6 [Kiritimatiellae bacterium]|nr:30S ribosomal protein S6 [Kiritimatiellia bacterium]